MMTRPQPKTYRDYDEIARIERSKVFHAGLAALLSVFKMRRLPKSASGDCAA